MSGSVFVGGCLCGMVRYRAEAEPFSPTHCHCTLCRKATGAAYVSWASFPISSLTWTTGKPSQYASSPQALREFCGQCGTQLTFRHQDFPDDIDITLASLDEPERIKPLCHIWTQSRIDWAPLDDLPAYPKSTRD